MVMLNQSEIRVLAPFPVLSHKTPCVEFKEYTDSELLRCALALPGLSEECPDSHL